MMTYRAYYNEIDPFAAAWLRELINAGHIAAGEVDERSIEDVRAEDLAGFQQCHFFAGIGGWSYALRLAGWPDDRSVWTGSCPCQPFSAAGKQAGVADHRHLWPAWFRLVAQCRPGVVLGEQVASRAALAWLDLVFDDLEGAGYACGAADLCAAGVGAPHIRQRLFWVAEKEQTGRCRVSGGISNADMQRCDWKQIPTESREEDPQIAGSGTTGGLGDLQSPRLAGRQGQSGDDEQEQQAAERTGGWTDYEWLPCRDGKARPTEPGLFPLAHGVSARMVRLRGYGNAIVPQVAAEFVMSYLEARP